MSIDPTQAVNFIKENAKAYAIAKGNAAYTDNYLKVVKAKQMNASGSSSLGAKEADAYASPEYQTAILANQAAIEEEAHLRWLLTAAQARIEVWKVEQYSLRQEMKNLG